MVKQPKYPLEQVLGIKKDRVDKAEKLVEEKKKALHIEEEKLKKVEEERNRVRQHHADKLAQLRKSLDEGTTSDEVLKMKNYLKVVKEKLEKEEIKVREQQKQVEAAKKALEEAKKDLKQKRLELEKLHLHKAEWDKEAKKEMEIEEAKEHDEIGTVMHQARKRQSKQ